MLRTYGPSALIADRIHDLQSQLPAVYDGVESAVHDARVAVRRACEALSLVTAEYDSDAMTKIQERLAKAARALGRVRDADCAQHLIQDLEYRFPLAATTLGLLRAKLSESQYASRRKVVKKLEGLELMALSTQLARARCAAVRAQRNRARNGKLPSSSLKRPASAIIAGIGVPTLMLWHGTTSAT